MIKSIATKLLLLFSVVALYAQEEVYEFRTYELEFFRPADVLHHYFEQALIPALNRQGVNNIGVFEETGQSLPKKIYLLIPYPNISAFQSANELLLSDAQYQKDAKPYLTANPESIPYQQISVNLIQSTPGFPKLVKPDDASDLFELRIYESYNEDALRRKVKMFNDSEFGIFDDVGLPTVFFGFNIAGEQMPCLTYMLAFKNEEEHTAAWSRFGKHPEWQRIVNLEEYKDAMNDITRIFLKPTSYSQL